MATHQNWTSEEIKYLKENYEKKSISEIGLELNRTPKSVQHKLCKLKLVVPRRQPPKVGDIIDGWKVLEVYKKKSSNSRGNRTMIKIQSIYEPDRIRDDVASKLVAGKMSGAIRKKTGWTIDGLSRHPLYKKYCSMKSRCYNEKSSAYENYGGRGIKICDEWLSDFKNFYNWALDSGWKENSELSLDRINNDGNYEPQNCRWTNHTVQCRNRRSSRYATAFGETKHIMEWATDYRCKCNSSSLFHRIKDGWNVEEAITTPSNDIYEKLYKYVEERYPEVLAEYQSPNHYIYQG